MNTVARTSEQIAMEINTIKDQTKATVLHNSIEIGRRLQEAKDIIPRGQWGQWLEENVDYSERTAQNLMSIYQEYGLMGKEDAFTELSYTKALALLALPRGEREGFVAENDVEGMSTRKLDALMKELAQEKDKNKAQQVTIESMQSELGEAKAAGSVKDLEKRLKAEQKTAREANKKADEASTRVTELEKQLKNIQPEVIEKVPDGITAELDRLRAIEKKAPNEAVVRYRTLVEQWTVSFNALIAVLGEVTKVDPVSAEKYKTALKKACTSILNQI